jgi:DNA-binding Lrp family transcriptional regulator
MATKAKKPTPRSQDTKIKDPDLMRAQATLIIQRRIQGASLAQVGREFNLNQDAVAARIRFAKQAGIIEDIKERVHQELLGPAIDALKMALAEGNVEAAKAVLFGTGVLQKNPKAPTESVEMTLTEYRKQKVSDDDQDTLQARLLPPELPDLDVGGREGESDDSERE